LVRRPGSRSMRRHRAGGSTHQRGPGDPVTPAHARGRRQLAPEPGRRVANRPQQPPQAMEDLTVDEIGPELRGSNSRDALLVRPSPPSTTAAPVAASCYHLGSVHSASRRTALHRHEGLPCTAHPSLDEHLIPRAITSKLSSTQAQRHRLCQTETSPPPARNPGGRGSTPPTPSPRRR